MKNILFLLFVSLSYLLSGQDESKVILAGAILDLDEEELINNVLNVINATANNYSSMHQDIAFMRKTEIEYINGYVLKMATKLKIKTPTNHFLVEQIRRLETKKDA